MRKLIVAGLHAGGSGYPNAQNTLKLLREKLGVEIVECGAWLPESLHLWRLSRRSLPGMLGGLLRLAGGNLFCLIRVLRHSAARASVYVPYPAMFFLWWTSWLPLWLRPKLIADAYISVWDSLIRDRKQGEREGLKARLLKAFETRALRAANVVLVDTEGTKAMYVAEFGVLPDRVLALPLAIDEPVFLDASPSAPANDSSLTVLFVGTMIPLHGIEVILGAIDRLLVDKRLRFRLVGDGQQGDLIARFIESRDTDRVVWVREWQSAESIAWEIAQADICLGVFGGEAKAARVLPFKLYLYFAVGKAVVSQRQLSLPADVPPPPIETVPAANAEALAAALVKLVDQPERREQLAEQSRDFFSRHLGSEAILSVWRGLLT